MTKEFSLAFSQAFGGVSEEEMESQLNQYFKEQYESDSIETISTELTVTVKKENKEWKIDYNQDELINAVLPGYREIVESMNNNEE